MTAPVFFLSYARNDATHKQDRARMKRFIGDISARVAKDLGVRADDICYFDEGSIHTGTFWGPHLSEAVGTVPVAVTLYSPSYFTSTWCGKEFSVFTSRAHFDPAAPQNPSGIVPVRWGRCRNLPAVATAIQYKHNAFPPEYVEVGLEQLMTVGGLRDRYQLALIAIADGIISAMVPGLKPYAAIDLDKVRSAWDLATSADPESHKKGGITKTCFVFASDRGWAWTPYPDVGKKIGLMAQKISADLDVYYEEIPCDTTLPVKLAETRDACIPTILFSDPDSLQSGVFSPSLKAYDGMYLPNCGAVVPWSEQSKAAGNTDPKWKHLQTAICHVKTQHPPPNHEWRSIFSQQDLELKTRGIIDDIRSRLLGEICSEQRASGGGATVFKVRKAEDQELTDSAAAKGLQITSPPQLNGPSK
jgi:hypothetical protein